MFHATLNKHPGSHQEQPAAGALGREIMMDIAITTVVTGLVAVVVLLGTAGFSWTAVPVVVAVLLAPKVFR